MTGLKRWKASWAYLVGFLLVALTIWPAFRDPHEDSFPFSTYPMFGGNKARVTIRRVMALEAKASRNAGQQGQTAKMPLRKRHLSSSSQKEMNARVLSPALISGVDEPIQAIATITQALNAGRKELRSLCRVVAERVAHSPEHRSVRWISIETATVNPVAYYESLSSKKSSSRAKLTTGEPVRQDATQDTVQPTQDTVQPMQVTVHARCSVPSSRYSAL